MRNVVCDHATWKEMWGCYVECGSVLCCGIAYSVPTCGYEVKCCTMCNDAIQIIMIMNT